MSHTPEISEGSDNRHRHNNTYSTSNNKNNINTSTVAASWFLFELDVFFSLFLSVVSNGNEWILWTCECMLLLVHANVLIYTSCMFDIFQFYLINEFIFHFIVFFSLVFFDHKSLSFSSYLQALMHAFFSRKKSYIYSIDVTGNKTCVFSHKSCIRYFVDSRYKS